MLVVICVVFVIGKKVCIWWLFWSGFFGVLVKYCYVVENMIFSLVFDNIGFFIRVDIVVEIVGVVEDSCLGGYVFIIFFLLDDCVDVVLV